MGQMRDREEMRGPSPVPKSDGSGNPREVGPPAEDWTEIPRKGNPQSHK